MAPEKKPAKKTFYTFAAQYNVNGRNQKCGSNCPCRPWKDDPGGSHIIPGEAFPR